MIRSTPSNTLLRNRSCTPFQFLWLERWLDCSTVLLWQWSAMSLWQLSWRNCGGIRYHFSFSWNYIYKLVFAVPKQSDLQDWQAVLHVPLQVYGEYLALARHADAQFDLQPPELLPPLLLLPLPDPESSSSHEVNADGSMAMAMMGSAAWAVFLKNSRRDWISFFMVL